MMMTMMMIMMVRGIMQRRARVLLMQMRVKHSSSVHVLEPDDLVVGNQSPRHAFSLGVLSANDPVGIRVRDVGLARYALLAGS